MATHPRSQLGLTRPPNYHGGTGEPLLLIHGAGGTWRQWRPVVPLLEPHHDVIAVNLVGHWRSTSMRGPLENLDVVLAQTSDPQIKYQVCNASRDGCRCPLNAVSPM